MERPEGSILPILILSLLATLFSLGPAAAQDVGPTSQPIDSASKEASESDPKGSTKAEEPPPAPKKYNTSRSISTALSPDPLIYVRNGSEIAKWFGDDQADDWRWLDFGIEHNTRYEHRRNYYPAGNLNDNRFLMRSRAFVGIREIADPLRFGFEFQDARAFGNDFPEITGDVNEADIQQAYAELYFGDAFGPNHPLSLRAGRMSFDLVNRRLFARNGFRNSTNAHDGFRIRAGDTTTPWEFNFVALQPVERRVRKPDRADDERWLFGVMTEFRAFDPGLTFEPYYFVLDEDRKGYNAFDRELHTVGVNLFGLIGESGLDYDIDVAYQFGKSQRRNHRAFAVHAELGHTWKHDWKPRLAAFVDYASGDRHPFDGTNERFDRLFGASHMFYAPTDMFTRENLIQPGVRLTVKPMPRLSLDGFYRTYWLASDSDTWSPNNIRDRYGRSGDFIGHGFDVVMIYQLARQMTIEIGYAHLTAGPFIQNAVLRGDDADFFYVQTTLRF